MRYSHGRSRAHFSVVRSKRCDGGALWQLGSPTKSTLDTVCGSPGGTGIAIRRGTCGASENSRATAVPSCCAGKRHTEPVYRKVDFFFENVNLYAGVLILFHSLVVCFRLTLSVPLLVYFMPFSH